MFLGHVIQHSNREKHFDAFIAWLNENEIDTSSISIAKFEEGYGLCAEKEIAVSIN